MLRTFVCAALALVIGAGVALAQKPKKARGKAARGEVTSITGSTLKVLVKSKKDPTGTEKEFKVSDDTKVVIWADDVKSETTLKDAKDKLKSGTKVTVLSDEEGKVTAVVIGNRPRKPKNK